VATRIEKLTFFVRHAISHLSRERQRTLFVLFCIAAGVAIVVALRTLGLMIHTALMEDLQAANRGDMVIQVPSAVADPGALVDPTLIEVRGGGPWSIQDIVLSESGMARLEAWADTQGFEVMPAWVEGGPFTRIYQAREDSAAGFAMARFVDPSRYPFYGAVQVLSPANVTLAEVLAEPYHVTISQDLADEVALQVGDEVYLTGSSEPFTVAAIADAKSEASLTDVFLATFPFVYVPYQTGLEILEKNPNVYYVRMEAGTDVSSAETAFLAEFPDLVTTTTADLRESHRNISDTLTRLVTVMGLVSLLIGGIGIANTTVVVVCRRNLEIAVLKTVGVQGNQIMLMFLVEALILGVLGSVVGAALGVGLVYGLRGFGESFIAQSLRFVVHAEAIGMGLGLGVMVTLAFSALPTLAAGQVRPYLLLRPGDAPLPRAGRLPSLLVVLALTILMGLIAGQILGDASAGLLGAFLTVVGLGLGTLVLRLSAWGLSRLPAWGSVSLKLAQRSINAQKGRTASTMLGLVIGVFSLSLILLLTQGTLKLLGNTLEEWIGGNVLVAVQSLAVGEALEDEIATLTGVLSYEHDTVYGAEIVAINGDRDVAAWVEQAKAAVGASGTPVEQFEELVTAFDMKVLEEDTWEYRVLQGQDIVSGPDRYVDSDTHILLEPSVYDPADFYRRLGLEPGDTITLRFPEGLEHKAVVAGITAKHESGVLAVSNFRETRAIVPPGFVPEGVSPVPSFYALDVAQERMNETLTALSELKGTFMVGASQMTVFADRLLDQFASLPLVVAALALFASGTIIANTISLATLERRRQIGVMKALGLQTERVLGLLLLENGLVGLAAGVIGVILGTVAISAFNLLGEGGSNLPVGTMGLLIALAVGLSLLATFLTGYGASREKPLHVLRYE